MVNSWILKGELIVIDEAKDIYEVIGQVPIEDGQGQKLDLENIIKGLPDMKLVGNGAIILTYGHTDLPCARTLAEEVVVVKDKSGQQYPALKLRYQITCPKELKEEVIKAHKDGKVRGVSIRGKKIDSIFTCKDNQCSQILETITKGEYYSFALCTDPVNRLALRLDQPDAPEIIQKAKEHVTDGKCTLCSETIDFYITKGYDRKTSEIIVKEALDLYKPKEPKPLVEAKNMEKPEIIAIVKEELKPIMDKLDVIEKAQKPVEPAPAPKDSEEVLKLKKANDDLLVKLKEMEEKIAKSQTVAKADPTPDANSGVSGPAQNGQVVDMVKGALQNQEKPKETGMTKEEAETILKASNKFRM